MSKLKWEVKKIIREINGKEEEVNAKKEEISNMKDGIISTSNELIEAVDKTIGFKIENTHELLKVYRSLDRGDSKEIFKKRLIEENIL